MHHVLYEWSELVEIDQRLIQLEKGIEILEDLNAILYNSDNKDLLQLSHTIQKELKQQFKEIEEIFENRLKKTNLGGL